jgi:hypothetical protein
MEEDVVTRLPFAVIDEIADGSPAAVDGLLLGDEIVKFGSVEAGDRLQERLVSEALSNEGNQVSLLIIRQGSPMNLIITPRKWHGRGLMGYVLLNLCISCCIVLVAYQKVDLPCSKTSIVNIGCLLLSQQILQLLPMLHITNKSICLSSYM